MSLSLVEALRLPLSAIDRFPNNGSEDIRQALVRLSETSEEGRRAVSAQLTDGDRQRLDLYAMDAASLAVRLNRLDLVHSGLDALDIEGLASGWSECESLPLLFRALQLLGVNAEQEFKAAAKRLHGVTRGAVLQMAREGGFPIERTRFAEVRDADGFRFVVESRVNPETG